MEEMERDVDVEMEPEIETDICERTRKMRKSNFPQKRALTFNMHQ
jgi:hypothetical protein